MTWPQLTSLAAFHTLTISPYSHSAFSKCLRRSTIPKATQSLYNRLSLPLASHIIQFPHSTPLICLTSFFGSQLSLHSSQDKFPESLGSPASPPSSISIWHIQSWLWCWKKWQPLLSGQVAKAMWPSHPSLLSSESEIHDIQYSVLQPIFLLLVVSCFIFHPVQFPEPWGTLIMKQCYHS